MSIGRVDGGKLARRLGMLLRLERQRRSLSQATVAERAGVAQQAVSRFESGGTAATSAVVERLFEAIGCQLRLETEPLDADLDDAMDRATDDVDEDIELRLDDLRMLLAWAPGLERSPGRPARLAPDADFDVEGAGQVAGANGSGLPYLLDGRLAAALQGVPVRPRCVELAVAEADLDRLAEWVLAAPNWLRWSERWHDFSNRDIDPRRPGALRWGTPSGEVRFRLLPVLPGGLRVSYAGRQLRIRSLLELGSDDPQLERIISRARARTSVT